MNEALDAKEERPGLRLRLDHVVIAVSDWERSNAFYRDILGAEVVERAGGYSYRFADQQLNVHGPGGEPSIAARDPVRPGNSDLCFVWAARPTLRRSTCASTGWRWSWARSSARVHVA